MNIDPYELTGDQKTFIRENATRLAPNSIAFQLRVPVSKVMQLVVREKLSIKTKRGNDIRGYKKCRDIIK